MKNKYILEAIRIGDQLLETAKENEHGIYWKTVDLDIKTDRIHWIVTENIYNGVSGIALFLLELYKNTNDKRYLTTVEKAMEWVEWYGKKYPTSNYAFISGRMGVSYAYLNFYKVTHKKIYLNKALAIAKKSLLFLKEPFYLNEYINGISGTLLVLIHLYAEKDEKWVLEYIEKYTDTLLKNAQYAKEGVYWDKSPYHIRPLCGFSHGTSGIGFVFLELGQYFNNPAFYYVAEQAFAYENNLYNQHLNNWPDLRMQMFTKKDIMHLKNHFKKGNKKIFIQENDMCAWCHGAAGIGLSRMRAYQLVKTNSYEKDINNAFNKTKASNLPSYTLCHGKCGNADIFIEKYKLFNDRNALLEAEKTAQFALEQKVKFGKYLSGFKENDTSFEDPSLFNGISGIGYFLLRVSNPGTTNSILAPAINTKIKNIFEMYSSIQIKKILLTNSFPQTMDIIAKVASHKLQVFLKQKSNGNSELEKFTGFVQSLIQSLKDNKKLILDGYFTLELTKIRMTENNFSNGYLFIKEQINKNNAIKLLSLSDKYFINKKFQIVSEVTFISINSVPVTIFLCKLTSNGVAELQVSQFCELVLQEFKQKKFVKDVIAKICTLYNPKSKNEKKLLVKNLLAQIKEAINSGILE